MAEVEALFRATRGSVCAGWAEDERGRLLACAPILRRLAAAPGRADRLRRQGWRVERVDPR